MHLTVQLYYKDLFALNKQYCHCFVFSSHKSKLLSHDTFTCIQMHTTPRQTLSALSEFISARPPANPKLNPSSQTSRCTHANKSALSDQGGAQNTTRGEWNAEVFVCTYTLLMLMGRYAGSSLQHLVISELLRLLPPESWVNRQGRFKKRREKRGKRPHFTR